jgi:hypothetical protein
MPVLERLTNTAPAIHGDQDPLAFGSIAVAIGRKPSLMFSSIMADGEQKTKSICRRSTASSIWLMLPRRTMWNLAPGTRNER